MKTASPVWRIISARTGSSTAFWGASGTGGASKDAIKLRVMITAPAKAATKRRKAPRGLWPIGADWRSCWARFKSQIRKLCSRIE